jgi:hypothetical protein
VELHAETTEYQSLVDIQQKPPRIAVAIRGGFVHGG